MQPIIAISVFAVAYALLATERVHRTYVAVAGALTLLLLRVVGLGEAFASKEYGVDWSVLGLLLGMMVIVGVIAETGAFSALGTRVTRRFNTRPTLLVAMLFAITAGASALLDNVTTVLLIVPMSIEVCRRMGLDPGPVVIGEALASNIGGVATLVGDPPNIIVASRAGIGYGEFLVELAPLAVLLVLALMASARFFARAGSAPSIEMVAVTHAHRPVDVRLLRLSSAVLAVVTLAFLAHGVTHLAPSVIALVGAFALLLLAWRSPVPFLAHVDWGTLGFFAGLFVLVGGLVKTGAIDGITRALSDASAGSVIVAVLVLLVASAVISGIVDNIPFVTTMAPVTAQLVAGLNGQPGVNALWWALVLGADLGGNATIVGASANIVAVGMARRAGITIGFRDFLRYGLPVTTASIVISGAYLYARHFAFA